MRKITAGIALCLFLAATLSFSQSGSRMAELQEGLENYQKGFYQQAIMNFRNIILDPALETSHGDAFFWLAKTYLILEQLDDASRSLETFLVNYPEHPYYSEAYYLKGRLLFKQEELQSAIQVFQGFIDQYPDSELVANAYFWVGEALFRLGNFDSARTMLEVLIREFPYSVKVEAAKYRISLVKLKKRENELLSLLKMSHEELLKTLEEFQKKERTYEQAIAAYQKKIAALEKSNTDAVIRSLREQLRQKNMQIENLRRRIDECEQQLRDRTSMRRPHQDVPLLWAGADVTLD